MNTLLKLLPVQTILGYFFPDSIAKFKAWQAAKTPENYVALGEAAANELASHFDAKLVPVLAKYEQVANPAIESIIAAVEAPGVKSVETAAIVTGTALAKILGSKSTPEEIEAAALQFVKVLNAEIGVA